MSDVLFSLDIGTRTVVGVVSVQNGDIYEVLDYEIKYHPDRAMFDGQIHDIKKVTDVVNDVKDVLEERTGYKLDKVAIAAAGRALKTVKTRITRELENGIDITKEILNNLEMEGIQTAQDQLELDKKARDVNYYCVGYNVCNYFIDGNININPVDHRGANLDIELIATFLPRIVVDSLYTVVDRAGLEVLNLTLEPIAAINIAIPQNLRLLNLALVDVGAGTSDIAITKDGSVISFGMVAAAGDKFTESLARDYLLDFDSAEKLKISLNSADEHTFTDIVGMTHNYKTTEIVEKLKPMLIEISEMIAKQILEYNEKIPSVVFCIGGGCQIPGFTEILAAELELPKERVVIKPVETLDKVAFKGNALKGPEFITPLGIGVTAIKEKENDFLEMNVNGKSVKLFNSKQISVSDALILVGYSARALLPERGSSLNYKINDKLRTLKGGYGQAAKIYVNEKDASLDVKLKNKDSIFVEPSIKGLDARLTLDEIVSANEFIFNDERLTDKYYIRVNDLKIESNYEIQNGDEITFDQIRTVKDLLNYRGVESKKVEVYVNGEMVTHERYINSDDIIRTKYLDENEFEKIVDVDIEEMIDEDDNFILERKEPKSLDMSKITFDYILLVNGEQVHVKDRTREMVFVDIFEYIEFDTSKPRGVLYLTLNGTKANYTERLKTGDVIEVMWK